MNREQIIETLRAHEPDLRTRGVLHVGLFGSVARGEAKPTSDIDILIETRQTEALSRIRSPGEAVRRLIALGLSTANKWPSKRPSKTAG